MLVTLFFLSGGLSALQAYLYGAESYEQYVAATTAPLFAGAVLMGAYGLMYAYKHRESRVCLIGFFITLLCYGFIEYLFKAF